MPWAAQPRNEPATIDRIERAILEAENRDPDALRDVLAPAPSWHTPAHNLIGGDHLGQEQAIRFVRDMREMTKGTLHVEEIGKPQVRGDTVTLQLRVTATRGARTLDTRSRVRMRLEEGRVAELWTEAADSSVWDSFWAP